MRRTTLEIRAPNGILDRRAVDLRNSLLLLEVVENDTGGGAENEVGSSAKEDLVRLHGCLDALDHRVGKVANLNELNAESIAVRTVKKYALASLC